jgi:hypothetical protein
MTFEEIFMTLEADNYPVTCDQCGAEGSNRVMRTHTCSQSTVDWDRRDETQRLHYLVGEGPER